MKVLFINGSPRKEGNTSIQTMRTLANNMTYMLKQFATGTAEKATPEEWQPMHFIR